MLRGVPTILVVYLVGFGVPALMLSGLPTGAVVLGGVALALCYSAYVSEVYRAGIESIHPSQAGAALALGLTRTQALRYVVLPQAVRRVVPPLLNDFISLQKDVALISILGPQEAFRVAQIFAASHFNYTPLIAAALLYLCVTIPLTRIVDRMQARSVRERGGALALGAAMTRRPRAARRDQGLRRATRFCAGSTSTVGEHEAVALIGASGSGKSTLLRCIDLLEEIDDGDILLDGEAITVPGLNPVPVRRRLGLVFQAYNLFPHRSVIENVILGAVKAQRMPDEEAREAGHALLERFGLGDRGGDYPDRLSGGQQQRVAIARALLTQPRALLLDEVTSALDPELVGEVLEVIRELKQEGMTMLIATHEMGFAREVADEVCYLQDGQIVERGSPEQIFVSPDRARHAAVPGAAARRRPDLRSAAGRPVATPERPRCPHQPRSPRTRRRSRSA